MAAVVANLADSGAVISLYRQLGSRLNRASVMIWPQYAMVTTKRAIPTPLSEENGGCGGEGRRAREGVVHFWCRGLTVGGARRVEPRGARAPVQIC